jgi:putative PIN family toxin of toxin-antitoxin system
MLFFQAASRPDRTRATFQAIQDNRVILALSPELLAEIQDVLNRDSIRAKFPALTPDAVNVFIADVLARGTMFDAIPHIFTWPQHRDDDHLFNLAIHAKAKYLVTWETRILKLLSDVTPAAALLRQLAPNLAIITPKQLADLLRLRK